MILDLKIKNFTQPKEPTMGLTTKNKPYIGFAYPKSEEQIKKKKNELMLQDKKKEAKNVKNFYKCFVTLNHHNIITIITEEDQFYHEQKFRYDLRPSDITISPEGVQKYLSKQANIKTKDLHKRITDQIKIYCYLKDDEMYEIIALYIMLTYLYQRIDFIPILHLNGEAGTGKSQIIKIATKLGFNASTTISTTSSSFFRRIDRKRGLYCMDEKEKLEDYEKELLNGCVYEGNIHTISEKVDDNYKDVDFQIYTPVILACINEIYGATSTRTIKIETIKPPRKNSKYPVIKLTEDEQVWIDIRDDLCIWSLHIEDTKKLMKSDKEIEKILNNRGVDTWKAILNLSKETGHYKKITQYIQEYYLDQIEEMSETDTNFMFIKYVLSLGDRQDISATSMFTEFCRDKLTEKQKEHFNITRFGRLMRRIGYGFKFDRKVRKSDGYHYNLSKDITRQFIENNYDQLNIPVEKIEEIICEEVR